MRMEKLEKSKQKPKKKINFVGLFSAGSKANEHDRIPYPTKVGTCYLPTPAIAF